MSRALTALVGAVAVAVLWFASRSLEAPVRTPATPGRLAPLIPLEGGVWHRDPPSPSGPKELRFRWDVGGDLLREEIRDTEDGAVETLYFWHPNKGGEEGSLALWALRAGGEIREGILREDESGGFEIRYNVLVPDGTGASYHERIRFLGPDRMVRSLHKKTEAEETLVEEHTFLRGD